MNRSSMLLFCLALMLTTPSSNIYSATLACEDGTVFVEDSRVDVLMICGEPDWKDSHQEEVVERLDSSTKQKLFITVEEWTYNFGPSQFMTIVTLKNGKVADIQYGNYGYGKSPKPEQREFSDRIVSIGDSQSDVIVKWGEPMWKNSRQEELREKLEDGRDRSVFVTIEEWTYNLGPNRFMRMLTFKNGRVTDIKTGSYGYEMN